MKNLGIEIIDSISSAKLELLEGIRTEGALTLRQNEEGEYILVNEVPFHETYLLTVVANGAEYLITVTDAMGEGSVTVHLYDEDSNEIISSDGSLSGRYCILVCLRDKNKKIIGYQYKWVDGNSLFGSSPSFEYDPNSFSANLADYQATTDTIAYDESKHTINVRMYKSTGWEPDYYPQIISLQDYVDGYSFYPAEEGAPINGNVQEGTVTTLNLHKAFPAKYQVEVKIDPSFSYESDYDVYAEAVHQSGTDTYSADLSSSSDEYTILIYDGKTDQALQFAAEIPSRTDGSEKHGKSEYGHDR